MSAWKEEVHRNAGWLKVVGILEILVGVMLIFSPLAGGLAVTMLLGSGILLVGIFRLVTAFGADSFGSGALAFIWGLLVAAAGFHIITNPGLGLATLTLLLAMMFFVSGLVQTLIAFKIRPADGWGSMLFGGVLGVLLAIMVWRQFPVSGMWLVGTLAGVHALSNGMSTIMIAGAARRMTRAA